mmetsp:Transcript_38593/g.122361  ORF Transcript_38593/g.122361 Transcript_38593/m.122361 type:complete len:182 (+) Transcript_38593:10150-10695(+)
MEVTLVHGLSKHSLTVPASSTFADVKVVGKAVTGVPVEGQKLLFRGRERGDSDALAAAGVKSGAKIMLLEAEHLRAQRALEAHVQAGAAQEQEAMLAEVRAVTAEVDQLEARVWALQAGGRGGEKDSQRVETVGLTDLLERQLLRLDGIQTTGGAREARRAEVGRVNGLCTALDKLREGLQ